MTQQPVKEGRHAPTGPRRSTRRLPWMLTPMEWRVVQAVCAGTVLRTELAELFGVDRRTIDHHLGKVYAKMRVVNLADVVLCVLRDDVARRRCWPELRIEEVVR